MESASDNDTGERPVREKLKKTSIATLPKYGVTAASADGLVDDEEYMASHSTESQANPDLDNIGQDTRGRPTRKRSFEDLEATDDVSGATKPNQKNYAKGSHEGHARKRSRDIHTDGSSRDNGHKRTSPQGEVLEEEAKGELEDKDIRRSQERSNTPSGQPEAMDEDEVHGVLSPRKKRSRDQVEQDQDKKQKVAATEEERARRNSEEEEKAAQAHRREMSQLTSEETEETNRRDAANEGEANDQDNPSATKVSEKELPLS